MHAPVYRSLEASTKFLGLVFPSEVLLMTALFIASTRLLALGPQALVMIAAYLLIVLTGLGKPPLHKQHLALFHVRRLVWGGRFSAAARAVSHAHCPFATYASRDVPVWRPRS